MLRTHTAGELNQSHVEKEVRLCGWVDRSRDIGQLFFLSLRDRYGVTQCVYDGTAGKTDVFEQLKKLSLEDCVRIVGKVRMRSEKDRNPNLPTGEIEVLVDQVEVLNGCADLPFQVKDEAIASDDLRLKYRYLDLRRPKMQRNLDVRHQVIQSARTALNELGFLEIETPLLIRSTPEGARDFVVPSRLNAGKFYALPQSPQLYKQMLMISGCDRYFQFAPAFRDEDLRADRVPVHTQIDMEMSFVEEHDVFSVVETYVSRIFKDVKDIDLPRPFPIMTYREAMDRYGCDKPDTRFGLELQTVTELAKTSDFAVFQKADTVRCLVAHQASGLSRKDIEDLGTFAQKKGAKGLAWCKVEGGKLAGGIAKFLGSIEEDLIRSLGASDSDLILFVADSYAVCCAALSAVRLELGRRFNLIDSAQHNFLWVNEFPLFEWDEEHKAFNAMHHLFTQPMKEDMPYLESEPGKVRGQLYDLVLNGVELLSGSIRINRPEIQKKVLDIVQMSEEEAQSKFGFLMTAFSYGAPPHGGSALGLDRLVAILCGENSIREVIAYPPNNHGVFPLDGSPAPLDREQLDELGLQLKKPE